MAGIGFRLQKLLSGDDYTSAVKAFSFSALITAGPFLLTILLVLFIQQAAHGTLTDRALAYLQSLITYGYAFSLVTVGPSYLVLTRYVADEYYRGRVTNFTACFFSAYAVNLLAGMPLVLWYFSGMALDWGIRLNAALLYALALGIWLAMVFLSAARRYWPVSRAFLSGLAVSLVAAFWLGTSHGLAGYFGGFVLGQAVVLAALVDELIREFGYWEARDHEWLRYFRLHPRLAGIGFLYHLGNWIDKFIFWASTEGEWLDPRLRYCPVYDTPLFFAYLTVLPAQLYFFIQVETDFFRKYHAYYEAVQDHQGLSTLESRRMDIVRSLRQNFTRVLAVQGIVSGVCILLVPWIVSVTGMDPLQMNVLRVGMHSAFLQCCGLILLNVLLYFDHQPEALRVGAVFCGLNAVLTEMSIRIGLPVFGYGYGLACLVSMALAVYYLNTRLNRLHFWTFSRQPFPEPVLIPDEAESAL